MPDGCNIKYELDPLLAAVELDELINAAGSIHQLKIQKARSQAMRN